jgi:phospholipid/cholesterol/gamma-HCH transport system permease protein
MLRFAAETHQLTANPANPSAAQSAAQVGWSVERSDPEPGRVELELCGRVSLRDAPALIAELRTDLHPPISRVRMGLAKLRSLDSASAALLLELRDELRAAGLEAVIEGATGRAQAILELVESAPPEPRPAEQAHVGAIEEVGRASAGVLVFAREVLDFTGRVVLAAGGALRDPGRIPWRTTVSLMERTGADALPIIALITYLVGLVSAFQAAVTLHKYGADIFVADGIAIGVTREFGPLMVAIVAAGRSGAAFAAEIGTMRVSEEVDALRTIGLDPYPYLVLPRLIALTAMVPILTVMGDVVAIAGGATVGVLGLDLTLTSYLAETRLRLTFWNIGTGLIKSVAFAMAIALIGCNWGLQTRGGAEGVGRATTSAVVTMLFALVIIDAAFTLVFYAWWI